ELNVLCSKKPILPDIYTLSLHDALPIFCNSAIDLIVRNDKGGHFKVGALQDEKAKAILKDYDIEDDYLDPIILVRGNSVFYKSRDRKSTRLNSSHVKISYAVFCLIKKTY